VASGGDEHRMLFDIRGRRKTAVKVVYAILAVLMGLSLFLVVGPLNIGQIFNSESSSGSAAKQFEEQAERAEAKLRKDPGNPDWLLALTRAQVNEGNAQVNVTSTGGQELTPEAMQSYQQASQTWSEYLASSKKPSSGLALLMSPVLLRVAEYGSRSYTEAQRNIEAAADAQQIVAEQRPSLNSYSTLALYRTFTGDFAAAETAKKKALGFTKEKSERELVEGQLEEAKKNAEKFQQQRKKAEKEGKKAAKAGAGTPGVEGNPLGGALGGGASLGE
jgi:hypothetical protein